MKCSFILFLLLNTCVAFTQKTFHLLDANTQKPIYYAQVFDLQNELIALSNLNGEVKMDSNLGQRFRVKHYDYISQEINLEENSFFYLKPKYLLLNEVSAVPFNSKNFYTILLGKTAAKLPQSDFYGTLNWVGDLYEIIADTSFHRQDTLYAKFDLTVQFQYVFKGSKPKLYVHLSKGTKSYYLPDKVKELMADGFYLYDLSHFFDFDLYDPERLESYSKRKKYKFLHHTDSISYLQINKNTENENFACRVFYHNADSSILKLGTKFEKIRDNSLFVVNEKELFYDSLDNLFYLLHYESEHVTPILGIRENIRIESLTKGRMVHFQENSLRDLEQQIKQIQAIRLPYTPGLLPKTYYQLFKN